MCLTSTVEDRNASIPLMFLVHCLSGSSAPCCCTVSSPKGSLGSGCATLSPVMLPLPLWLSLGAARAVPPSHPLLPWPLPMACSSSCGDQASCLWVQQVSSVFFSLFVLLQPSCWEQIFLHCQEQHNLQHFLSACWAKFANPGLILLPPGIRIYLFLQGMSMDFATGGLFLP